MIFGSHVSIRNGYFSAAQYAASIEARAFQFFPKNPRSLTIKPFNQEDAERCKTYCQQRQLVSIAHTPYPTSLTPHEDKKQLTIDSLVNDLEIAEACGAAGVVVHFGTRIINNAPLSSYRLMIAMLNKVLQHWDGKCKILLENNAGKAGSLGVTMEELVQVRNLTDFPEHIGFCLDTCHAFASGLWNGDNWQEIVENGEKLGYFEHLKAIHLNNSKYPSGQGKDRHANLFHNGKIHKDQLLGLINSPVLSGLPFVLETPSEEGITHAEEIQQLHKECGK